MSRAKTFSFSFATFVFVLLLAELICAIGLRIGQGHWIYTLPENQNYKLFEPHPQLVAVPRKNVSVTLDGISYHHNSDGYRGAAFSKNGQQKKIILCIGGSTTYGVGVSNNQTWPYYLDSLLPPEYAVLNLGIPGHSTVEHVKMLPQAIEKYTPDIVILHCGLNDIRNMHVQNLGDNYSGFHQPSLYASMGFCMQDRLPPIAVVHAVFLLLQKSGVVADCPFRNEPPAGTVSDAVDTRVLETCLSNMVQLFRQCERKNITVYVLPQVLSQENMTEENMKWWIPFLTKKGIDNSLRRLNDRMQAEAGANRQGGYFTKLLYIDIPRSNNWGKADFCDAFHLNEKGNRKLAEFVAAEISVKAAVGSGSGQ